MYNSIYPVNINYHKNPSYRVDREGDQNNEQSVGKDKNQQTFPNGAKVSIDYSKGQINISQVINDFKNTIIAINAPAEVADEVNLYLGLVERESLKEIPSKEIILSNLKNASRISDDYIARSLNKPSNVVQGWIDALFLQKINLKADPSEINPNFLLEFPKQAQDRINQAVESNNKEASDKADGQTQEEADQVRFLSVSSQKNQGNTVESLQVPQDEFVIKNSSSSEELEQESSFELSDEKQTLPHTQTTPKMHTLYTPESENDKLARELFIRAKNEPSNSFGDTNAINMLNEALGVLSKGDSVNGNIKAAIHFERGKIFDDYDYVDYALRDYWEASKTDDLNLKAKAFYKSAKIYDEFKEFNPALDNYLSSVAYSGEAGNSSAQTIVLRDIATLYAGQFDYDNTSEYSNLALETAKNADNIDLLAETYSQNAQNFQYLGENDKAIDGYKNALAVFSKSDESYEQMAYNYEQASKVMRKLGNSAKADKLLAKANLYYRKAQQQQHLQEEAS